MVEKKEIMFLVKRCSNVGTICSRINLILPTSTNKKWKTHNLQRSDIPMLRFQIQHTLYQFDGANIYQQRLWINECEQKNVIIDPGCLMNLDYCYKDYLYEGYACEKQIDATDDVKYNLQEKYGHVRAKYVETLKDIRHKLEFMEKLMIDDMFGRQSIIYRYNLYQPKVIQITTHYDDGTIDVKNYSRHEELSS